MRKKLSLGFVLLIGLALGYAFNFSGVLPEQRTASAADAENATPPTEVEKMTDFAGRLEGLFQAAADKVMPTVVSIQSTRVITQRVPGYRFRSPFEEFFGREMPGYERFFEMPERERQQRQQGLGSGLIIDDKGYILTNNHVIADADELRVQLADGRSFDAEIIGTDPKTDLAVIRLTGDLGELPVARTGNSDDLKVAEWVLAIGNPFGLTQTVSAGIVSAKGRSGLGIARYESLIQTDAAINPGNSGGPLINLRGEVIGINTAIFSSTGGSVGIGFAIPVNMASDILDDLIAGRQVVRGWLGVSIRNLTPEMAEAFEYEGTEGALVEEVVEGSPAEKAGVKAGDIIMEYDGKKVATNDNVSQRVAATKPGNRTVMKVWRDGKTVTIRVKIGDQALSQLGTDWLGVTVAAMTPEKAKAIGLPDLEGVIVTTVTPNSPAARKGVQEGHVIVSVHRRKITSPNEYRELVNATDPGGNALLRILDPEARRAGWVLVQRPRNGQESDSSNR
jgi:serine protease Do